MPITDDSPLGARLHSTMDAVVWAKEFVKLNPGSDEELMRTWFANSLMCGWDHAHQKLQPYDPAGTPLREGK